MTSTDADVATKHLNRLGQSVWVDDITRELLDSGTLARYVEQWSVTGLTSNPTIFDHAITHSGSYDPDIARLRKAGLDGERLFFELAIADLGRAADLFRPIHRRTASVDGWVSLEVSPLLARDTGGTVASASALHVKANRPNLFIKIPGTPEGLPAIEEAVFHGIPVNVTLLFSPDQYVAAAEAYMKGLERRVDAGLTPDIRSVASLFISRWDRAVAETAPARLKNQLGLAIGHSAYHAYRQLRASDRWQRLESGGARPQRLLFASTGTKDPQASDVLYVLGLAAPNTINTMPEATLKAVAGHGGSVTALSGDGGDADSVLAEFARAGVDIDALAVKLQADGADAFIASWRDLLQSLDQKMQVLA